MPTSNGLITARDIRQKAVKSLHIVDANVTTSKIADLAVTFPDKIDDPFYVAVGESALFHNAALTTTFTEQAALSFAIPAWVNQIFVFAISTAQITNTSGSDQQIRVSTGFGGTSNDSNVGDRQTHTVPNNDVGSVAHVQTFATTGVAGSTFTVEVLARVDPSTNSINNGEFNAFLLGTR